ncbi:hypothetical protein TIFTF001_002361 [Ficus carica]|uniref:Uncharacterized protein n=1 Tax=Ficus carica TaxID=3494 RepID=A0AA87ZB57_FICCA|nr:hypothetical protein TIFTF001_002361 [Ficus carica]
MISFTFPLALNLQTKMDYKPDLGQYLGSSTTADDQQEYYDHHEEEDQDHDQEEGEDQEEQKMDQEKPKMGRGRIEYKLIQNPTNRQVTYSKRKNGIFKKAKELAVLCDAKVSLIMISHNANKMHEYHSPDTSIKQMLDLYQKTKGIDVWETQYEKMQQILRELKEKNYNLRRQIRQRMGHDLSGLNYHELHDLESSMSSAVEAIRAKKEYKIKTTTETTKKRVKSLQNSNLHLVHDFQMKCACEDPPYGMVEDHVEGGYEAMAALANGASNLYAFRHHNHHESCLPLPRARSFL